MSQKVCGICLSDIENNSSFVKSNCDHNYHTICWNQYNKKICAMCRNENLKIVYNTENIDITNIHPESYVWLFGSFNKIIDPQRDKYLILSVGSLKYSSGYFWRIYDSEISQELEENYQIFLNNKDTYQYKIEVGSISYNIYYDHFDIDLKKFPNVECNFGIQQNNNLMMRPIIRIKWRNILDNLLVIGIHDKIFFENLYVYMSNGKYSLFNMENQKEINDCLKNNIASKYIDICGSILQFITDKKILVDKDNVKIYDVMEFNKQNIINF